MSRLRSIWLAISFLSNLDHIEAALGGFDRALRSPLVYHCVEARYHNSRWGGHDPCSSHTFAFGSQSRDSWVHNIPSIRQNLTSCALWKFENETIQYPLTAYSADCYSSIYHFSLQVYRGFVY